MGNPFFRFKEFTIFHDRCAMKVGTDGVLLGAWTDVSHARNVLDIGTGTGLIALMLAQRCADASIVAIDIEDDAVSQATDNVKASLWSQRITPMLQDVRTFRPVTLFDTIVSNPPYFIHSLKSPDEQRNTARHTDTLDADSLLAKVSELLSEEGRFSIILPAEQADDLIRMALQVGLYPSRRTDVVTRPGLPPKRVLMEFRKVEMTLFSDTLVVELERHVYSEAYIALTKDFYLKM